MDTNEGDVGTRKQPRYAGILPGNRPGTWRIDFYDWSGKRRNKTFAGTEAEAARVKRTILVKQDKIKAGLEAPPEAPAKAVTVHQLWEAFEADRLLKIDSGSMSESSFTRCRNTYDAFLEYEPGIKARRLDEVASADFEGFKIYRQEQGFAPEGVNTNLRGLRTLFNFAVRQGFLAKSPLRDVPLVKVPHSDVRFLNQDELASLQFAIEHLDFSKPWHRDARDLVLFYLYTGCRLRESLVPNFTWANDGQNALHFHQTKTSRARSIPKGERIRDILEGRKAEPDGPFNFSKDEVYNRVTWLLRQAGIDGAAVHTLRKTAGSMYYLATRDIFATSRFLGHSSVKVTEEHYAGLIQSLQVEYHQKFEETLTGQLLFSNYLGTKPDQSSPIDLKTRSPNLSSEKGASQGAGPTRLELATSGLTGRRSNQLNYGP